MHAYQGIAFRIAYLVVGNAAEAEDAAQDAFVKAYRALHRFRSGEPLLVNDHNGMWIQGAPHVVMYFDSTGRPRDRNVRIAGNVLMWAYGSVTLRIEGPITKARALGLAASIR